MKKKKEEEKKKKLIEKAQEVARQAEFYKNNGKEKKSRGRKGAGLLSNPDEGEDEDMELDIPLSALPDPTTLQPNNPPNIQQDEVELQEALKLINSTTRKTTIIDYVFLLVWMIYLDFSIVIYRLFLIGCYYCYLLLLFVVAFFGGPYNWWVSKNKKTLGFWWTPLNHWGVLVH